MFKKIAKYLFFCFVVVSFLFSMLLAFIRYREDSAPPKTLDKYEVFEKINAIRKSKGLTVLKWNPQMCTFTHIRLEEIHSDWSHNGYQDVKNYYKYRYFGENLIKGFFTPESVVQKWVSSPEHYENISDPHFTDTCIDDGESLDQTNHEKNMFVVQHFASF